MYDVPPPPDFEAAEPGGRGRAEALAERQLRMLRELAEIGMDLARALRDQAIAKAEMSELDAAELGLSFARVARAVRLTLVLETRIFEGLEARRSQARAAREARLAEQAEAQAQAANEARERRRAVVHRVVEETIEAEIDGEEAVDAKIGDLYERLDEDDAYADFADRPIGEVVASLCRDLGLNPDWSRWAAEPWAIDEARAAAPGSPYAFPEAADAEDVSATGPPP